MKRFRMLPTVALAAALFAAPAMAADEGDGLDELLDIDAPKPQQPAPTPDKPEKPEQPATDKPVDGADAPEGIAKPKPEENFAAAVTEMKQAGELLDQSDASRPTVRLQEQVIARLDQLIADARKKQSKSKSKQPQQQQDTGSKPSAGPPQQGQQQPNGQGQQPAQQAGGPGSVQNRGDTEPLDEQFSEWGNLPDRIRKELLQGRDDRFSTLYDKLTQRYYKRLAEETP